MNSHQRRIKRRYLARVEAVIMKHLPAIERVVLLGSIALDVPSRPWFRLS